MKLAPVAFEPHATAPLWISFLWRIMGGKEDPDRAKRLVDFLQRAVGYSLTGSVREHALFFAYGSGQNGKSTMLDVLRVILGDYARAAAPRLLLAKKTESHPTEMASLHGARFVTAIETDKSGRFDESILKWLTGGDMLTARRMREDFWEFPPTHKFWVAGNHRPKASADDPAIWRRMNVIPFEIVIPKPERDKALPEKLMAEASGILRWAVEGCLAWQKIELDPPNEVEMATEAYRKAVDVTERFLDERCVIQRTASVSANDLYTEYTAWCADNGERPLSQRKLGEDLDRRGFEPHKGAGGLRVRLGIGLLSRRQESGASGASGASTRLNFEEKNSHRRTNGHATYATHATEETKNASKVTPDPEPPDDEWGFA